MLNQPETVSVSEIERRDVPNKPHECVGPLERLMPGMKQYLVDLLDLVPELPRPTQRWTVARKAMVIQAVRGGWVPIEEIVEIYDISVDEFLAWERDVDRYGVPGLRATRFQIYRDTDKERRR